MLEEDDWTRGRSPCLGDPSSVHWGCMSTLKLELVEPLSASSRTTPRDKKVPFGPVKKVTVIDEKVIKIENDTGIEVFLEVEKLAPLIDKEDSRLKKELIILQNKDPNVLAKSLNDLITKMHGENFRRNMSVNLLKRQSTLHYVIIWQIVYMN